MWKSGLKYAFVTNYNTTIFLKRERDARTGTETLYYSGAISCETKSTFPAKTRSQGSSGIQVSLRECMLFLQYAVQGDGWQGPEGGDRADWVKEVPKKKPQQPQSGSPFNRDRSPRYDSSETLGSSQSISGSRQSREGMAPPSAPQTRSKSPRERNAQEDSAQEQSSRNKGKNRELPPRSGGPNRPKK